MRLISSRKLDEVEALLERMTAVKRWLEAGQGCGCATPAECTLFPATGEDRAEADLALRVVQVTGTSCRRASAA